MLRETFPSEAVQLEIYTQVLEAFAPNPVVMRTLDIGGDKTLPYFPIDEPNALLGWRGIRIMLHHPEIFLTQIKAMLRAHRRVGNLRILLPMVSCLEEIKEAKSLLIRAMKNLRQEGVTVDLPALGVMLEVPAALFALREFATEVDFFSIGTNDLTQYMMAVDRGNPRVAPLYDHLHPVMLRSLRFAVGKAHELGTPISVCGELAGDPAGAVLLLGMDIDYLSMSAASLPRVKWAIRSLSRRTAGALLDEALARRSATQVRALVHRALEDAGVGGLLHAGR